jgi:ribonuclease BN (tRNA processing enzyme)
VLNGRIYLVDAARNVSRQIVKAGFPVKEVDHLFFSHFHSDHYTGFPDFYISRWLTGAKTPLRVYGPPPVEEIVRRLLSFVEYDVDIRVAEGKQREGTEVEVTVLSPGDSFEVDGMRVSVERGTHHGNVPDILSYRFEAEDRAIVLASDGSPTEKLVPFSKGADVLVMHVCIPQLIIEKYGAFPDMAKIAVSHHATAQDLARTATDAGVGALVFSHVIPPLGPNEEVLKAVSKFYEGKIIPGEDLMRI